MIKLENTEVIGMETACTRCAHREVCIYKEQFLKMQEAVNNVTISYDGNEVLQLKDATYIKPAILKCYLFLETVRQQKGFS